MIKTMKKLMRIARKSDGDATTKQYNLKKVKTLKTGLFTFFLGDYNGL